jgi:uncharacterized protein (TIGR02246 family)
MVRTRDDSGPLKVRCALAMLEGESRMTDQDDVLRVIREQEAATARGDAAGIVAAMAEDVVTFDLPPPLQSRGDDARNVEGLEGWFGTWETGVTVTLDAPEVIVSGDLAVVWGLSRMQGTKKGAGPVDSWSRRTVVLRRAEGTWRIVHDHGSFPMAMDGSGRALDDLAP